MIKTKSFELAVYAKGDPNSPRLALILPGRLDTKDYIHMTSLVDALAEYGYYALSFDPPGSWESAGDITLYTTTTYLQAVDELIEHFGSKPTLLVGHSRGGTIAMLAGCSNPHVTKLASIMSYHGPAQAKLPEHEGEVLKSSRDLPPGTSRSIDKKWFDLPYSYFEDQKQYDAIDALRTCTKPKLFFYGTEDTIVDKDDVMESYNAAAEPKLVHELKSEHDYRLHPEIIAEVKEAVVKFVTQ